MDFRSDLAVEQIQTDDIPAGVTVTSRGKAFGITEIVISDDSCRETLGKGRGRYITLESGELSRFSDGYEDMAEELAEELRALIPDGEVLVVGVGHIEWGAEVVALVTGDAPDDAPAMPV